jgi:hypothetical protein
LYSFFDYIGHIARYVHSNKEEIESKENKKSSSEIDDRFGLKSPLLVFGWGTLIFSM